VAMSIPPLSRDPQHRADGAAWSLTDTEGYEGYQVSTRLTAARMRPGRAATGMPRTKTLGVPALPRATAHSVTNDGQGR
jgi:hypothetical protein